VVRVRAGKSATLVSGGTAAVGVTGGPGTIRTRFTADNGYYGRHYRGSMLVRIASSKLAVVNRVQLDSYIRGVVPSEMPSSWNAAALQAQAIAARSYAVATRRSDWFDAYADTRSQMYTGIEGEATSTDRAVAATAGKVATYRGAVIPTFFFSTSGGRTAAIEDVWGGAARPYLKSVADPYEDSPHSTWSETRSTASFTNTFDDVIDGTLQSVRVETNASKRVDRVVFVGSGGTHTLSGSAFQSRLGLRSTWFAVAKVTT
jgi:stage II sporulation protein D